MAEAESNVISEEFMKRLKKKLVGKEIKGNEENIIKEMFGAEEMNSEELILRINKIKMIMFIEDMKEIMSMHGLMFQTDELINILDILSGTVIGGFKISEEELD